MDWINEYWDIEESMVSQMPPDLTKYLKNFRGSCLSILTDYFFFNCHTTFFTLYIIENTNFLMLSRLWSRNIKYFSICRFRKLIIIDISGLFIHCIRMIRIIDQPCLKKAKTNILKVIASKARYQALKLKKKWIYERIDLLILFF